MRLLLRLFLCLVCLGFMGCAEIGLKPHKPKMKSTRELAKIEGVFRILPIRGSTPEIDKILDGDLMNCNGTTTFSMPRGNTVGTFIKEIFEQELDAAKKLSINGVALEVVIKSMSLENSGQESGVWTIEADYMLNDKKTGVKNVIEFESKLSMLSSCVNTANVFEEALADNFVEFFKKRP